MTLQAGLNGLAYCGTHAKSFVDKGDQFKAGNFCHIGKDNGEHAP